MSHPNAKNSGSKREKGEKRYKRAEKNDYLHMIVTRDSNCNTSACVRSMSALGRISAREKVPLSRARHPCQAIRTYHSERGSITHYS